LTYWKSRWVNWRNASNSKKELQMIDDYKNDVKTDPKWRNGGELPLFVIDTNDRAFRFLMPMAEGCVAHVYYSLPDLPENWWTGPKSYEYTGVVTIPWDAIAAIYDEEGLETWVANQA
jgi:hypothetical protein